VDVVGEVVVVVVEPEDVALSTEQVFHWPGAGSPKVVLLQAAEPVKDLVKYAVAVP